MVKAARSAIELRTSGPKQEAPPQPKLADGFDQMNGIFVTLERYPSKELRGCIGFPKAIAPIRDSVAQAAIAAAFEDPRFYPVSAAELGKLTIEISVLSSPTVIEGRPEKRMEAVKVGRDGLIIERGIYSGLLLPIVPVEQGWDEATFLSETCAKAGLHGDCWTLPDSRLYKFESQIFREETPGGRVVEVDLAGTLPRKTY